MFLKTVRILKCNDEIRLTAKINNMYKLLRERDVIFDNYTVYNIKILLHFRSRPSNL